jgi:RNA polymerase sigma-B factor
MEDVIAGLDIASAQYALSLDAPVGEDDSSPVLLADAIGAEDDRYRLVDATATLSSEIPRLPYHERQAFTLRLTEDLTQREIAERLGCSQMQISRLIRRSKDRLRARLNESR